MYSAPSFASFEHTESVFKLRTAGMQPNTDCEFSSLKSKPSSARVCKFFLAHSKASLAHSEVSLINKKGIQHNCGDAEQNPEITRGRSTWMSIPQDEHCVPSAIVGYLSSSLKSKLSSLKSKLCQHALPAHSCTLIHTVLSLSLDDKF